MLCMLKNGFVLGQLSAQSRCILTYGANARQLCEFLTLTPAVFVTVQAADFLHDETIRKLITWHWAGKVLFLLGTPLLEHLTGFFFLEALHLCLLLCLLLALKIEDAQPTTSHFLITPQGHQANNVKDVKVRNSESDKDTRDTTLSLAENCNTLVGSARIFTDPPSVLASEITLKEHYTKHDCIEDALLRSPYTNGIEPIHCSHGHSMGRLFII
ncbi:unnamed protein product, partial [Mesorhabditis belari]|uniref:Uncharacterized protein n=1 Tax=Mesorhabditis belari TaxID=2138241 RepID=A0AAF3ENW9_9BILA